VIHAGSHEAEGAERNGSVLFFVRNALVSCTGQAQGSSANRRIGENRDGEQSRGCFRCKSFGNKIAIPARVGGNSINAWECCLEATEKKVLKTTFMSRKARKMRRFSTIGGRSESHIF
jgi:hypothetical protein